MPSSRIKFHQEDLQFKLPRETRIKKWLKDVSRLEGIVLNEVSFIFCTDEFLLDLNKAYLKHTTLTDIITFDYSEKGTLKDADIFISIERVKDNSAKYKVPFEKELHRVIVHGVLHLAGYKDKTHRQKQIMRKKEDTYLSLLG